MNLLGLTVAGATSVNLNGDREVLGGPYLIDREVTLAKLTAYVNGKRDGGIDQPVRAVVRTSPAQALVAASGEVVIAADQKGDWIDWPFDPPTTIQPGSYEIGLHAGAGNTVRAFGNADAGGRLGNDTYADGPSATQTSFNSNVDTPSAFVTYFYPWTPPPISDLDLARYGFYTAQAAIGTVAADPRTSRTVQASWHGTKFDPERQDASFAVVQVDGELTDFVGQRVKVTSAAAAYVPGLGGTAGDRSVIAYVHRETDLDLPDGEQISLTRRLYQELAPLATNKLLVTVEALGLEDV